MESSLYVYKLHSIAVLYEYLFKYFMQTFVKRKNNKIILLRNTVLFIKKIDL